MFKLAALFFWFNIYCGYGVFATMNPFPSHPSNDSSKPKPVYTTTRLVGEKPKLDGVLNDACWNTGEWAGEFKQWIPAEGKQPSQSTFFKILYDDENLYVAVRAVDHEPKKIQRKAGRRDEFAGDVIGICFDSYHDHRTGFEFDVTAAGQKYDAILTNPMVGDANWNAVWYAKTAMEDSAWTTEMRIPLSQLRYSSEKNQVWGLHFWRWINRLQEESDWEQQSFTGPGMLYLFGELKGISNLPKSQRIELLVSGLSKMKTFQKDPNNIFASKGHVSSSTVGLDAKIGLSSNFTVDLSINPDFGQVEADPSVMNLTAFEPLFEEKRPFFLEGKNIFSFDIDDLSLFYSRRIGHAPSYMPGLGPNEYLKMPDNTTILSAAKLSGKTQKGLSVVVLQSLTANERASISTPSGGKKVTVEPLTNYFVGRMQQDYRNGNTVLGGIFTSTNRFFSDPHLNFINHNAFTGGLDLLHQWKDKEFFVDAKVTASNINGSTEAISDLQLSSARYFQRPDAYRFDSTLTQLSGIGGKIKIGKGSKGLWRYSTDLTFRSPTLELNDIGYMQTADLIKQGNAVSYFVNTPVAVFRTYTIGLKQNNNWDFKGHYLSSDYTLTTYLEFLNRWNVTSALNHISQSLDIRQLRGGEALLIPPSWMESILVKSDFAKKVAFNFQGSYFFENKRGKYFLVSPGITVQPINTLKLSLNLNYTSNMDQLQYTDAFFSSGKRAPVLARIDQHDLGATFRIDYNITNNLSLQYYGSPFASVGKFNSFKKVVQPKNSIYSNRFQALSTSVLQSDNYLVDDNGDGVTDIIIHNPDFNFYQFRSNFVFRYEYRPGSQLYFVWSNDRTNFINPGSNSVTDIHSQLSKVFPTNIFLVKLNYWFDL
ncbi:DUF5916 domain-containing protein [Ferruginibacter paludis]|uniref:DUF5916 domain-containing protein n=1 Tax=Ferruginibacter paludis TaxID=1310417 RepID=UPI0025B3AB04|nr:DUF5916 domain-containing protein [Ferruginibacter paludis]MDN3657606.1 DUF5916 domain-containing protein [Ferruginibacter paludis]